jgi:hypothetical protein
MMEDRGGLADFALLLVSKLMMSLRGDTYIGDESGTGAREKKLL